MKSHPESSGLPPPVGYSHVVEAAGNLVFIAGQVSRDAEGKTVGVGDLAAQTAQVYRNLHRALAVAGATFDDVVKLNTYVVDFEQSDLEVIRSARAEFMPHSDLPVGTLVGVAALAHPDLLIEVEAVAVLD